MTTRTIVSTRARCRGTYIAPLILSLFMLGHTPAARAQATPALAGDTLRSALAAAYLQVDRLVSANELTPEQRALVNQAFDRTTFQFFGGRYAEAIRSLDSLRRALGGAAPTAADGPPTGDARSINGRAPSVVAAELRTSLTGVDSTGPLQQAYASVVARIGLLTDVASPSRSIEMLIQPQPHAAAVRREVAELRAGRHPYAGRSGDWWRVLAVSDTRRVPMRVIAPPSAVDAPRPAPLIVALHGAGGDENMFVDAYGAGALTRLADSLGALLVSPLANGFTPVMLDSLLAVVSREYAVDSTRVYVIGHSMGAGITAALANTRGERLAAVAFIAGGAPVTTASSPPSYFVSGALDPVIPAARVKAAADATQAAGRTMQYREYPSEGHTLIVGYVLSDVVTWLMGRSRQQ